MKTTICLFLIVFSFALVPDELLEGQTTDSDVRTVVPHCTSVYNGACNDCDTNYNINSDATCDFDTTACSNGVESIATSDDAVCDYCDPAYTSCTQSGDSLVGTCAITTEVDGEICGACAQYEDNTCLQCIKEYELVTGVCERPASGQETITTLHCLRYDSSTSQCVFCDGVTSLSNGECSLSSPITGCSLYQNGNCIECLPGYAFYNDGCSGPIENCKTAATSDGTTITCSECIEGFYVSGGSCLSCDISGNFTDGCSGYSSDQCSQCNRNCRSSGSECVSKYCSLFNADNECVRCEDGYQFSDSNTYCVSSTYDGCVDSACSSCEDGYYRTSDTSSHKCEICEGDCKSCFYSKSCYPNEYAFNEHYTQSTQTRCSDQYCLLCDDSNPEFCLSCEDSDEDGNTITLSYGECVHSTEEFADTIGVYQGCVYKTPIDTTSYSTLYSSSFSGASQISYFLPFNGTSSLECEVLYYLPSYYSDASTCIGANRNPKHDCECNSFYYGSSDKSSDCSVCDDSCLRCTSEGRCVDCPDGAIHMANGLCACPNRYYLNVTDDSKTCIECATDCSSCTSDTVCECYNYNDENRDASNACQCKSGYAAYSSYTYCKEIPTGCDDTSSSYTVTSSDGDTLISCSTCDESHFDPTTDCEQCLSGYYNDGSDSCDSCPTDCATCYYDSGFSGDGIVCTKCYDENAITDDTETRSHCQDCSDSYYPTTVDGYITCNKCPSACKTCGFNDTGDFQCFDCYYTSADPYDNCTCGSDQYFNSSSLDCGSCGDEISGCSSCYMSSSTVYCSQCEDDSRATPYCTSCASGYYSSGDDCLQCPNICSKCAVSDGNVICTTCANSTETGSDCTSCIAGYYYDSGCNLCPSGCSTCTSATECTSCTNSLRDPDSACSECTVGYYLYNDVCTTCETYCDECEYVDGNLRCLACSGTNIAEEPVNYECVCSGEYYMSNTSSCLSCRDAFGKYCTKCTIESCEGCEYDYLELVGDECVCGTGYYTSSWGACIPCDRQDHCEECDGDASCTQCESGYDLKDGICSGAGIYFLLISLVLITFLI